MRPQSLDAYAVPHRRRSPRVAIVLLPLTLGLTLLFWGLTLLFWGLWQALIAAPHALSITTARFIVSKWTLAYIAICGVFMLITLKTEGFFKVYSAVTFKIFWLGRQPLRIYERLGGERPLTDAWYAVYWQAADAAVRREFDSRQLVLLLTGYAMIALLVFLVIFARQFARQLSGFGAQGGSRR